jgi:tetratricopeptide (TPR) repeat protein
MKRISMIAVLAGAGLLSGCGAPTPAEVVQAGATDFQLGRLDKARAAMEQVLRQEPSHPDALFFMGRICQAQGLTVQARYYYECCLDAAPGYPEAEKFLRDVRRDLVGGQ